MASSKEYLDFILEQLSELEEITYKTMMGEYIFYYRGKIIGGIYDDRFLVKPVKSAIACIPNAKYELPYDGAKKMLLTLLIHCYLADIYLINMLLNQAHYVQKMSIGLYGRL